MALPQSDEKPGNTGVAVPSRLDTGRDTNSMRADSIRDRHSNALAAK